MKEPAGADRWNLPIPLETNVVFGMIDSNNSDANRISATAAELLHLVSEVIYHSINLLEHRLRQNFDLYAYFDGGNWSASNQVSGIEDWCFARYDLTESSISTACRATRELPCLPVAKRWAIAPSGI